ncbi:MAG TPA: type I phosphomannose isomerase catalytic subunit [Trueperaceae bacterium]|nr:type I phosphomannose isomerase catalytic subunit [Trueperaceae bacterium]
MTAAPYPLLLTPRLYRRLWGGELLADWFGSATVSGPEHEPVGEAWLMDGASVIANGASRGLTLDEVAAKWGAQLLGEEVHARYGAKVPLLAKFLDAAADLSVQVHPDDAYALREHPGSGHLGKAEAWYLLEAAPGAEVLWGFQRAVTPAEVRRAVADGTITGLMRHLPVAPGSVVVNPAGTVHAVGAGCMLFEIQQASDLTYRLFDYGRLGGDGQPRTLHLDRALDVADLRGWPPPPPQRTVLPDGWTRIVAQAEFTLDRLALAGGAWRSAVDGRSFQVLVVIEGALELRSAGGDVALPVGTTAFLPAALGEYELSGRGAILRSAVGS